MNIDVEFHIKSNYTWQKLPANIKKILGNSQREYDKAIFTYSVKNQLRYKGNIVRYVRKDEKRYYEELLRYSREHLMLYPYHLSDVIVKGLRITPFAYYINMMCDIMNQEKSYDSLPNFTAADCLRLMGIGRNQYIDLMNQCRSSKNFFRRKPVRDLLPMQPVDGINVEPWWVVQSGYVTEDDIKMCMLIEKNTIDQLIDKGPLSCGERDYNTIQTLFKKGLIYLDVPITDSDRIVVPPLEGFVMNRVLGDYFETLLYKIFVSIDEHTTVAELANVLEIDIQLVKNAVSVYCRLGFAKKKTAEVNKENLHSSWKQMDCKPQFNSQKSTEEKMLIDWSTILEVPVSSSLSTSLNLAPEVELSSSDSSSLVEVGHSKRIAFLFDSTLTAFLMMGNLSPGLKNHAVTMFEVGKLSDESMDSFITELEKVQTFQSLETVAEGEAQRYFDHAITLRDTLKFLRYNPALSCDEDSSSTGHGVDLIRCEALHGLDSATCSRVLKKNYSLLVSMAPISNEIRPITSSIPQHIGPSIAEVNSPWFKLYIYSLTNSGPPSLLVVKGTKLRKLPTIFEDYDRLLVTTWGHDAAVINSSNILLTINDALLHSAVFIQAHGWRHSEGETFQLTFPLTHNDSNNKFNNFKNLDSIRKLSKVLDLEHICGFITLLNAGKPQPSTLQTHSKHKTQHKNHSTTSKLSQLCQDSCPQNGFQNKESAEVLAKELDNLDIEDNSESANVTDQKCRRQVSREALSLNLSNDQDTDKDVKDWCLLDCNFGLPLFDANLNREVCDSIVSKNLCSQKSLECLLQSSRKLALNLLNFISSNQDLNPIQTHHLESGMISAHSSSNALSLPLPTHNIFFDGKELSSWNSS